MSDAADMAKRVLALVECVKAKDARIAALESRLAFLISELRDREDIDDGAEGPIANDAMRILAEFERRWGRAALALKESTDGE